jgi:multidrug efflux pump subunit AcrA (membrane-fusion protein)
MTADVKILLAERKDTLRIPVGAFYRKRGATFVEVPAAGGGTEEREVKLGITDGVLQEVLEGLAEGDKVVVRKDRAESRWRPSGGAFGIPGGRGMP